MEYQYLIPIVGVVLGWFLSQLTGMFSLAREDRRCRSAALPAMVDLYFQQYRINKILEFYNLRLGDELKELCNATENNKQNKKLYDEVFLQLLSSFEVNRQRTIDLPQELKESLFKSLTVATDSLSKVAPALAYRLSRLSSEFSLFQVIKFPEMNLEPTKYFETYENLLGIFRADLQELRRLIIRTALGIGVFQLIEILLLVIKQEKELNNYSKEAIETLLKSIKSNLAFKRDALKRTP
jgi:hypothetical protein